MFDNFLDTVDFKTMCTMVNVRRTKGYQILKDKLIPHKRNGKTYLIKKADVIAYIENLPE